MRIIDGHSYELVSSLLLDGKALGQNRYWDDATRDARHMSGESDGRDGTHTVGQWRDVGSDLVRAFSGGMIFGVPLLFTMRSGNWAPVLPRRT